MVIKVVGMLEWLQKEVGGDFVNLAMDGGGSMGAVGGTI